MDDDSDYHSESSDDTQATDDELEDHQVHLAQSDDNLDNTNVKRKTLPALNNTQRLKAELGGRDLATKVESVFKLMEAVGLNLPLFLDAVCWGDQSCVQSRVIQWQRTSLMVSEELPGILARCHQPPRAHSKGVDTIGAKKPLEAFAISCVTNIIDFELIAVAQLFKSPPAQMNPTSLISKSFSAVISELQSPTGCPTFWKLLRGASVSKRQTRNTRKNPDLSVMMQICQAAYCRSNQTSWLPKLLSIYLKVSGVSARALDTLHTFGITMSHRWIYNGIDCLAASSLSDMKIAVQEKPWILSHDNLNIPFRVFEQRINNQSHFDSGTAATIYTLNDFSGTEPSNPEFQRARAAGRLERFDLLDVHEAGARARLSMRERDIRRILSILTHAIIFDFKTYPFNTSEVFAPAKPVDQLPCGPDHVTHQYMLSTAHIDEATYSGMSELVQEWNNQMGLTSVQQKMTMALKRLAAWIGDQLTIGRLRGLFNFRGEDFNAYDRLDWMLFIFGWFHLMMTFATSLHKQYLGTAGGHGLRQAFGLLQRKGLNTTSVKGPFHHHLDEAIKHISEAHFRCCWLEVGKVDNLAALRSRSPSQLRKLAEKIVQDCASSEALATLDGVEFQLRDDKKRQATMWNRDVLRYLDLSDAIKYGDVGIMEDSLPHLLYRFSGGGNSNYTIEVLELFQGFLREWPADVKNFVRKHCWLVNMSGRRDGHTEIDKAQEHNIKDVKYTFQALGPYATWEYIKKISPAIPTMRAVKDYLQHEMHTLGRGKSHTSPAREEDVVRLTETYHAAKLHQNIPGRSFRTPADKAPDIISLGIHNLHNGGDMDRWWAGRNFERATDELQNSDSDDNNTSY